MNRRTPQVSRAIIFLGILLTACTDEPVNPQEDREAATMLPGRAGGQVSEQRMRVLLRQATREIAVALADDGVRASVYAELHASPYREHKLHLSTLLRKTDRALLDGMATARQVARGEPATPDVTLAPQVLATLDSIVDLEFYMPVKEHFAAWDGGATLIVASTLRDDERTPYAFDLSGVPVALSGAAPPATPTLVLVPVETDFSRPATAAVPGGMGRATMTGPSVYMTRAIIYDNHEGWLMGDGEFEVHLFQTDVDGEYHDQQCAGQDQGPPYQWNTEETQDWSGVVTLATEARLALSQDNQFQMWENDGFPNPDACTASGGMPPRGAGNTATEYLNFASAYLGIFGGNPITTIKSLINAVPAAYAFFDDGDDAVGVLSLPGGCWPGTNGVADPVVWWLIRSPASSHPITGNVLLDFGEVSGAREPICALSTTIGGPTFTYDGTTYNWTANVSNGSLPYTYEWYRNEVLVGSGQSYSETVFTPNFDLRVIVTDAVGATASQFRRVTVSTCTPPQKVC